MIGSENKNKSFEFKTPIIWGLEVHNGNYIRIDRANVLSEIKHFCQVDLVNKPERKLAYIESCFNDKYSEEILITILEEIVHLKTPITVRLPSNRKFIIEDPIRLYREQYYNEAQELRSEIEKSGYTIFSYCNKYKELLKNNLIDDPWLIIIENLLEYYNDIEKWEISKQSKLTEHKENYFLTVLKEQSFPCYTAFKSALEGGLVCIVDGYYDFNCGIGCVHWFFRDGGFRKWSEISRFVTVKGKSIDPDNLGRSSYYTKPNEFYEKNIEMYFS